MTKQGRGRTKTQSFILCPVLKPWTISYGVASGKSPPHLILWRWDNMVTGVTHPWLGQVISWFLDAYRHLKHFMPKMSTEILRPVHSITLRILSYIQNCTLLYSFLYCSGLLLPDLAFLLSFPSLTPYCTLWNSYSMINTNNWQCPDYLPVALGLN